MLWPGFNLGNYLCCPMQAYVSICLFMCYDTLYIYIYVLLSYVLKYIYMRLNTYACG